MNNSEIVEVESGPVATVEWFVSHRNMSNFIRSADLGMTDYGYRERFCITYYVGSVVDEERVLKAVGVMIRELNEQKSEFEISDPKVVSIR